jgi:hypothetical protein
MIIRMTFLQGAGGESGEGGEKGEGIKRENINRDTHHLHLSGS